MEDTDFGHRLITLRNLDNNGMHVRVTNQIFPSAIHIPLSNEMTLTQWHVPIDDVRSYWYAMFTSFGDPVDQDLMRKQRLELYELPDYIPKKGKWNDYGYNPNEQMSDTYTGMGSDINVHDQWAVESQGTIQDRTKETLAASDVAIKAYRKNLLKAIQQGEDQSMTRLWNSNQSIPKAIDVIASLDDWENAWAKADRDRRQSCSWKSIVDH